MSQSPIARPDAEEPPPAEEVSAYAAGWNAINRLMRQGWSWSGRERNEAFLNLGGGRFADASFVAGFDAEDDGRAAVRVDWDRDGDLDVFTSNRNGPRLRYFENRLASDAGWLAVKLRGTRTNLDGIGARVEVEAVSPDGAPRRFRHTVRAGEGYLAQSSSWVHAGLGDARPTAVIVYWPGGDAERFEEGLAARAFLVLEEGRGRAERLEPAPPLGLAPGGVEPPPVTGVARVVLAEPVPMPPLDLSTPRGDAARLFELERDGSLKTRNRPLLLALWAGWCAPCRGELRGLEAEQDVLAAAGADVLALSVDEEADRAAALGVLQELGWTGAFAFAEPEATRALETLAAFLVGSEQRLALPTSLLIDAAGSLRVLYTGPVEAARVRADLALLELEGEDLRRAAAAGPGTFHLPFVGTGPDGLRELFAARGLEAAARQYGLLATRLVQRAPADLLVDFGRRSLAARRVDEAREQFEAALAEDPEHVEALLELGRVLSVLGDHAGALARLRRAVELAPEQAAAHHFLGIALAGAGDLDGARAELAVLERLDAERARELAARIERAATEDE